MRQYRVQRWAGSDQPDANELRERMIAEGYSVYQWSDLSGAVYSKHEHPTDQSHWIISGALELHVDGRGRIELRAGDRDFMRAGTIHSARVLGPEPVVYLIGEKA